ncbi:helix-turn-helix transcriptional regulator [Arenibacterium sp. CAU 1754]
MPAGILLLITIQVICTVFFTSDVITDYREQGPSAGFPLHLSIEALATLSLVAAIAFETYHLVKLLRRKAHLENSLQLASAAVHDVINAHFENWQLSPSETDVANFLVKGLEIAEIARVRGCAEGTVKAHLNAIYRKSGTHSRGELLSVLIDGLLVNRANDTPSTKNDGAAPALVG